MSQLCRLPAVRFKQVRDRLHKIDSGIQMGLFGGFNDTVSPKCLADLCTKSEDLFVRGPTGQPLFLLSVKFLPVEEVQVS